MAKEDKFKNCWCEVKYFLPKTSCQIRCTRPEKHLCQIICPTAVKEHTDKQNMLSYRVSILSYDSEPKSCNCMHKYNKFGFATMYDVWSNYSTFCTHFRKEEQWSHAEHVSKCGGIQSQQTCLCNIPLSFFFSQHRIRTRQNEVLLNLTHYTFVSKTSVLSYSKPDIHR